MTDISVTAPAIGESITDFTADTSEGTFRLSEHIGKQVVLYFYPKDNTPGCTTQAQGFRDLHDKFTAAGAIVVGVSRDTAASHARFTEKQNLPFTLIADTDEALCRQFDVIKMKNMYGKQVRGIVRSTFLIDPAGKLAREWRNVKVPGHVEEVLRAVQEHG